MHMLEWSHGNSHFLKYSQADQFRKQVLGCRLQTPGVVWSVSPGDVQIVTDWVSELAFGGLDPGPLTLLRHTGLGQTPSWVPREGQPLEEGSPQLQPVFLPFWLP